VWVRQAVEIEASTSTADQGYARLRVCVCNCLASVFAVASTRLSSTSRVTQGRRPSGWPFRFIRAAHFFGGESGAEEEAGLATGRLCTASLSVVLTSSESSNRTRTRSTNRFPQLRSACSSRRLKLSSDSDAPPRLSDSRTAPYSAASRPAPVRAVRGRVSNQLRSCLNGTSHKDRSSGQLSDLSCLRIPTPITRPPQSLAVWKTRSCHRRQGRSSS
jgi:hypothetical protein